MELCLEWREKGEKYWSYQVGSRGLSETTLELMQNSLEDRAPQFEYRIIPYITEAS